MTHPNYTELSSRLAGRRVVASISGGKDSAAMSLHLSELGIEHDRLFLDTGWENQQTYEYLRTVLPATIGQIVWARPALPAIDLDLIRRPRIRTAVEAGNYMVALCLSKAMFPSRTIRFCTQQLKIIPAQKYLSGRMDAGEDIINAVGIRAAESAARSAMAEWEWSPGFDCEVWRPLISWSEQAVIDIHKRHGLVPNPLYLLGAARVGCWPCIYARKAEIRFIADTDPERISLIEDLEAELTERARERAAAAGEELRRERTWFQQGSGRQKGELWPIGKTTEWARTSRGGRQFEMFAPSAGDQGCMRWGLCETGED